MFRLLKKIDKLRESYHRSAKTCDYYDKGFSFTALLLSLASTVLGVIGTNKSIDANTKNYLIIMVTVLSFLATIIQMINGIYEYNTKKLKFYNAGINFEHLLDRIIYPDEEDIIEENIAKIKNNCIFLPIK